ncbi:hypothetical protein NZK35_06260 [Stieleria sp. ICT_E10.1]|uniref:hypothetical protein n=1 Tax=Stieleria sedimenti TaxID=2976331 RepID=UPI0021807024|nr:hypothetical protein [Stieleria sedimenti]MCS7466277.1 hypothetical protein [Stieleria sedimenti]
MNKVFETEYGPLKPYQRPLVVMLILLIPIVAAFTISWLVFNYMYVAGAVQQNEFGPAAVIHETVETAVTGNELVLQLRTALADFDGEAKRIFGADHHWSKDGESRTPTSIYDFVHDQGNTKLLDEYDAISKWRVAFAVEQANLESNIDRSVSTLSDSTTKDASFQALRLVSDIEQSIREVNNQLERLRKFGEKYDSFSKGQIDAD